MSTERYELSGGGVVTVYRPFGDTHYVAVVESCGVYPALGSEARNRGRAEHIVVLEGSFAVRRNGQLHSLAAGDELALPDGVRYTIEGTGRALVMVHDQPGGETEILDAE